MMLQLFLTVIMLALAAFEVVVLYQGHFVARSVTQFETYVHERGALEYCVSHGVARMLSDASLRERVAAQGAVSYDVGLSEFVVRAHQPVTGSIQCLSLGNNNFRVVVEIQIKSDKASNIHVASDSVDLLWNEERSIYIMRSNTIHS